jgi:hypothetical protein
MICKNVGQPDRIARGLVGSVVIILTLLYRDNINDALIEFLLYGFGLLNMVSMTIGWCMVYKLAGINTIPKSERINKQQ